MVIIIEESDLQPVNALVYTNLDVPCEIPVTNPELFIEAMEA